jgi:hypothetical protein
MLWVSLGVGVVSLVSDGAQLSLVSSDYTREAGAANDARQQLVGLISIAVFIVTGITFLKWIYRANFNSRGFGAREMKFTPGWSVGYYFIPFLNLVRPYQAMKEIWQASKNPLNWQSQQCSGLLGWWWALWLINSFLGQISFRLSLHARDRSSLQDATVASMVAAFADIFLCIVAVCLVSQIFGQQKRLVEVSA